MKIDHFQRLIGETSENPRAINKKQLLYGLLGMAVVCGTVYLSTPEILTDKNSDIEAVSVAFEDPDVAYFADTD